MAGKYTKPHTLNDIKERHKEENNTVYKPRYDKPLHPVYKENETWKDDMLRSGVERYFLLKNEILREIMETYGEYTGEIDYGKNVKITFKSEIEDDKEDWNKDFTGALIANFGGVALGGDFPIPAAIINYLRSLNSAGKIAKSKILHGNAKARFEQAIFRVRELVKGGFPEYTALAITGMTWTEDGWSDVGLVNKQEQGGDGASGTGGINAGESVIGITFASTKIKVITKAGMWNRPDMGSPSNFAATYKFGISKLPMSDQIKCCIAYYQINGRWSHALLNIKNPNNDLLRTIVCCAAYRSKSGDSNWPGDTSDPNRYIECTENGRAGAGAYRAQNGYEGFSVGIIMAYLLAKVIKAKNEGNDNWNAVTRSAVKEIESQVGSLS